MQSHDDKLLQWLIGKTPTIVSSSNYIFQEIKKYSVYISAVNLQMLDPFPPNVPHWRQT